MHVLPGDFCEGLGVFSNPWARPPNAGHRRFRVKQPNMWGAGGEVRGFGRQHCLDLLALLAEPTLTRGVEATWNLLTAVSLHDQVCKAKRSWRRLSSAFL